MDIPLTDLDLGEEEDAAAAEVDAPAQKDESHCLFPC
jgi:hypothetical protein